MTPQEINAEIHVISGLNRYVGLKKYGLWYRPNACGYTDREDEAGRYTREESKRLSSVHGEDDDVTIHEFSPSNYYGDLNEIAKAEATLTDDQGYTYTEILSGVLNSGMSRWLFKLVKASSQARSEAFLRALGKWRNE